MKSYIYLLWGLVALVGLLNGVYAKKVDKDEGGSGVEFDEDGEKDVESDFEREGSAGGPILERERGTHVESPPKSIEEDEEEEEEEEIVMEETERPKQRCSDEKYCHNGGTCYVRNSSQRQICLCLSAFKGERCEQSDMFVSQNEDGHVSQSEDGHPSQNEDGQPQAIQQTNLLTHPIILTGIIGGSVLLLCVAVTLLVCCCLGLRRKNEGSYALGAALQEKNIIYTKVQSSNNELYA